MKRLRSYQILDTAAEKSFDDLAQLAAHIVDAPISLVSLIDLDRQWFKAKIGTSLEYVPRASSFCGYTILGTDLMVVKDAHLDDRFRNNPFVQGDPHIRFYAGVPLTTDDGHRIGTLSCIGRQPREITAIQEEALLTLSRQVVAQIELRQSFREMRAARDALVELQKQRQCLLDFVAHDMKNALQLMLGYTDLLESSPTLVEEDDRSSLLKVKRSGQIMDRMLRDMLDISKDEQARLTVDPTRIDLTVLLKELVESFSVFYFGRKISLRADTDHGAATAWADLDLVRRVLENLVDNDLKYVPKGGSVVIRTHAIVDGWVDITVEDDGPGVPAADRVRIFDKYARISTQPEGAERASFGLGLAFCRMAVESCGGNITVEGASPRGSVFRVRLPTK